MLSYERFIFGFFNIGARLFGIFVSLSGILFVGIVIYHLIVPHGEGGITYGTGSTTGDLVTAAIMIAIGLAVLFTRPYHHDVDKEMLSSGERHRRNWWTGAAIRRK